LREYEEIRVNKKIKTKLIYYKKQYKSDKIIEKNINRQLVESRVIEVDLETPANTVIWYDCINIVIHSDPLINIEIKNEAVVKAYLNYFHLFWNIGK